MTLASSAGNRVIEFAAEGITVVKNVLIPMRDGIELAADLYVPRLATEALPVVIEYNPYRKDDLLHPVDTRWCPTLTDGGYIFLRLDCRGTGGSSGTASDEYSLEEQTDGYDAIEWIAQQEWCDGSVAMLGISYSAFTALQVAALAPPHLKAIIPIDFTDDRYSDTEHFSGGLLRMFFDAGFYGPLMVAFNALPPDLDSAGEDWAALWKHHLENNEPYLLHWYRNQVENEYWDIGSVRDGATITCPVFLIGGWHDGYPNPPLRLFGNLTSPKKVLVGPWDHEVPDRGIPGPRIDYLPDVLRWLDRWCKGQENGIAEEPPVTVFVQRYEPPGRMETMESGDWRAETDWPIPGGYSECLMLATRGRLAGEAESEASEATLHYVPWVGVHGELFSGGVPVGRAGDQRPEEAYSLTYTSEPLAEPLTIVGRPKIDLRVSSSANVVGLVCRLAEVGPDGSSRLITKGALNLTRRTSMREPTSVVPGEQMDIAFELDAVAWSFTPGNRIRVSLSNADFPNLWPTPENASTIVYAGGDAPSSITLPAVPARGSAVPPDFRPIAETMTFAARLTTPRATDEFRPVWEVVDDCLNEKVRVSASWLRKAWGDMASWTMEVDKRDPARASANGQMLMRRTSATQVIVSRSDIVVRSTDSSFHITVGVAVEVNGLPFFDKSWVETVPRVLL